MSAAPDLVVDSATGVEVSLPMAGPGARAFAFLVDWHIRAALALAWYVVAALIYNRGWNLTQPEEATAGWFGLVVLPCVGLYLLYHPIIEIVMHGRTPGKRIAGVRIVTRHGAAPDMSAHLIRNVFRLVDSLPALYALGLVAVVVTRDHVRIGDLAAGTLLVYDRRGETALEHLSPEALGASLDASTAEIVSDLLQRWHSLDPAARRRLAIALLERSPAREPTDSAATGTSPNISTSASPATTLGDDTLLERLEALARGRAA